MKLGESVQITSHLPTQIYMAQMIKRRSLKVFSWTQKVQFSLYTAIEMTLEFVNSRSNKFLWLFGD